MGVGKRLGAADVDKWALYVIGQYCDQSVPDGFGGTEPRITCNAYLTTQRKAWDVLSDFCSAMRCMPVWNGQTLTFVQDGTFKPAYSNNMAWCLWDMLTHPRYGMGKRLGAADVDKWALYVIGQYCDQSVPDGFGGTEPRITCNAYLATQRKAWDVLSDFCSAMRCMPVWNGQTLTFVQDRPSDKVWTYNRSNVVMPDDGAPFRYSFSALLLKIRRPLPVTVVTSRRWMPLAVPAGGRRTAPGCG